jgi:hypothetical protein
MSELQSLTEIYPKELTRVFPALEKQIDGFLKGNGQQVVTLNTPAEVVKQCAEKMKSLATTISEGIKNSGMDPVTLYLKTTQPARTMGTVEVGSSEQVGLLASGNHRYHILEKVDGPIGRNLLLLLQRIPYGMDTGSEVHGVKKAEGGGEENFVPDETGGIEVYLPLVDGITFHVNDQVFQPKALGGLVTILAGDNHRHIKDVGHGPARVLIFGGCGFGMGTKTKESFEVPEFAKISRFTPI